MLTASNIAAAMGVSKGRIYRALSKPYPLSFILSPTSRNGGASERLYQIGIVLPRIKSEFFPTDEQIKKLFIYGGYNV